MRIGDFLLGGLLSSVKSVSLFSFSTLGKNEGGNLPLSIYLRSNSIIFVAIGNKDENWIVANHNDDNNTKQNYYHCSNTGYINKNKLNNDEAVTIMAIMT